MQNLRLFFTKTGTAKYISHLDLMRAMTRAVKRAQLPMWYTEGFNPHLFMTFALPLSLGVESLCESVEMRLIEEMSLDEVKNRLNGALPQGIKIISVAEPLKKASEIAYAEYNIEFDLPNCDEAVLHFNDILSLNEILVEKKSKQGRRKVYKFVNIKENIKSYSIKFQDNKVILNLVLTAGQSNNINPSLLIAALTKDTDFEPLSADIKKIKLFCDDMTDFL